MTVLAEPTERVVFDDKLARRNARVLAAAQALAGGNNIVIISTGSIVGAILAPDKGLATLPVTTMVLGMWLGTLPVGAMARAFGRRNALQIGSVFGIISGLVSCLAVFQSSFWLLLAGTFIGGLYAASLQSYRFAAADTASEKFRPKAVSWVLAGGVFSAVLGPQLVIFTKDIWAPDFFAATYLGQSVFSLLAVLVLAFVKIPNAYADNGRKGGRPLIEIVRTRHFIVAVGCGVASYSMMTLIMTAAPLAMVGHGHTVTDATLGIQWHVLAMFAPSFITGSLIGRFGVERVTAFGLILIFLGAVTDIAGTSIPHFWAGLILLGVGWNFGFIGATNMITQCHRQEERTRVQAFNDFLIFGSMALASFTSGKLLALLGWAEVNHVVFPTVLIALALLVWQLMWRRTRAV